MEPPPKPHAADVSDQLRLEIELLETRSDPAEPTPAPPISTRTVLIVDDDADMCRYVTRCLKAIGFASAEQAADGLEALERLALCKADLVITDVMMPRMDGLMLCTQLHADAELREIPILFMTGELAVDELRQRLPPQTTFAVLAKPFSARMLREAIGRLGLLPNSK